jgi:hypothetical protein
MKDILVNKIQKYRQQQEELEITASKIVEELNITNLTDQELLDYLSIAGFNYIKFCLVDEKINRAL